MLKFSKGAGDNKLTFPLTQEQIDNLKPCGLHSPRVGHHHGIELPKRLSTQDGLEETAREVAMVVNMVQRGEFPREQLKKYYPESWGEFPKELPQFLVDEGLSFDDPLKMAEAVHMDLPTAMPNAYLKWLLKNGYEPHEARKNCVDFLEYVPETIEKISNAVRRNLETAFEVKCYYGVPRPEEVLGYNITAYNEGCPPHASFMAGHHAAAMANTVTMKRFNIDDFARKQGRDGIFFWSMQRYMAGMHFPEDNLVWIDRA